MILSQNLKSALTPWVKRIEDDLLKRCKEDHGLLKPFEERHQEARESERTAFTFNEWFAGERTQIAVAWVLACVFARFLEDQELIGPPKLSGPGKRRQEADDQQVLYFREHPLKEERDYLEDYFKELATLPGLGDFLDQKHNPLWQLGPSGILCREFILFWREHEEESGELVHDFTDPEWNTRFLGDLYQDLSEAARKRYALLQTPDFVEEFILDRTLTPAIETFGFREVRLIDPTCGSGHFLLGAFERLFTLWLKEEPGTNSRVLAQNALSAVYGVDLNPFAVSIASFRLLIAALKACGDVKKLRNAPAFQLNLAVGDSLLHGRRFRQFEGEQRQEFLPGDEDAFADETKHFYEVEDSGELHRILGQQYHAVVANPPYITVKDKALNTLYRNRFESCYRQYSLSVPFMERIFDLTICENENNLQAGFCGQITSNSFMKREFGKKLITEIIPAWNITHVVDASGAYIPGHGTPTVMLFGRNRIPTSLNVRALMGIKGEPSTPDIPSNGRVWQSILNQIDKEEAQNEFLSSGDVDRAVFNKHPWSLQGGGASETKIKVEAGTDYLKKRIDTICLLVLTRADDFYLNPHKTGARKGLATHEVKKLVSGDGVRDFLAETEAELVSPYTRKLEPQKSLNQNLLSFIWPHRTLLWLRSEPNGNHRDLGRTWWEWSRFLTHRVRPKLSIAFAEVATHNHFVLDRGGKVFKQTAPIIKLPEGTTEEDHFRILGPLNSSTACFWMQQVFHNKGGPGGGSSKDEKWHDFFQHDGTKLKNFPVPKEAPLTLTTELDRLAQELASHSPNALTAKDIVSVAEFTAARVRAATIRGRMIALQEESDWECYRHYELCKSDENLEWPKNRLDELPSLTLGERAFEIAMAREIEVGRLVTKWFSKHELSGSKPITKLPIHWPADYRALVERRLKILTKNNDVYLIECPNYKRRWETKPWENRQQEALRQWLLARLEGYFLEGSRVSTPSDGFKPTTFPATNKPALVSLQELADATADDTTFLEAATLYHGAEGFDRLKFIEDLCTPECVPQLPVDRYKPDGIRKRHDWEETWKLQRHEDKVEARIRQENPDLDLPKKEDETEQEKETRLAKQGLLKQKIREAQLKEVGKITVPPKYGQKDFQKAPYWKMRGKLDVPKERWVSFPGLERESSGDRSLVIAWAGWDHAQQAKALAEAYLDHQQNSGWSPARLAPALAGLAELLPWLHQWHNEHDVSIGMSYAAYFQTFVEEEARNLGYTMEQINSFRYEAAPSQSK